jgi:hypothetical protein
VEAAREDALVAAALVFAGSFAMTAGLKLFRRGRKPPCALVEACRDRSSVLAPRPKHRHVRRDTSIGRPPQC